MISLMYYPRRQILILSAYNLEDKKLYQCIDKLFLFFEYKKYSISNELFSSNCELYFFLVIICIFQLFKIS